VLLSEDIFNIPVEQMKEVRPFLTVLGGAITFEA